MDSRRKQITEELDMLRTPIRTPEKVGQYRSTVIESNLKSSERTRKKIFSQIETIVVPHIRVDDTYKKQGYLTPRSKPSQAFNTPVRIGKAKQERKNLSTEIKKKELSSVLREKAISKQIDFDSMRGELVGSRIKIFRSKEKINGMSLSKSKSPKSNKITFERLKLSEMPGDTRKWYERNSR